MNQERLMQVLLTPHVSEKSTLAADKASQHVFKVLPDASKTEVKKAVELMFDVKVDAVRVVNVKGKSKRFQQQLGKRKDYKKAYVRLAAGQDISFEGAEG
ncbi:MAG: 50S ribosomal protein L23 [Gammaproteobacteria bacterium]|nr:50S ribosomal protein L23 [Gammaproteobacteria bacterium]